MVKGLKYVFLFLKPELFIYTCTVDDDTLGGTFVIPSQRSRLSQKE
jgi:hypothetical protein